MVESISRIGHLMGVQTIAEYVENDDIVHELKSIGVTYAQGFAIGDIYPFFNGMNIAAE